jgi:hypothetical protein
MKQERKFLYLLFLFTIWFTTLYSQEAIPVTGGNATGNGGSFSYTIGQVVFTAISGSTGTTVQGVQQPFEISVATEIEQVRKIDLVCSAYPNPTTDFVTLRIGNGNSNDNLSYQLYDINGILLENKKITINETIISMHSMVPSTYFLKIIAGNREIKTFKIIKNQ